MRRPAPLLGDKGLCNGIACFAWNVVTPSQLGEHVMGRTWYQPSRLPAGEATPGRRIHARLTSSRVTPR
jgi:hypothetical protein